MKQSWHYYFLFSLFIFSCLILWNQPAATLERKLCPEWSPWVPGALCLSMPSPTAMGLKQDTQSQNSHHRRQKQDIFPYHHPSPWVWNKTCTQCQNGQQRSQGYDFLLLLLFCNIHILPLSSMSSNVTHRHNMELICTKLVTIKLFLFEIHSVYVYTHTHMRTVWGFTYIKITREWLQKSSLKSGVV